MAFPTIPTAGAGRVLSVLATNPAGTHTSPNLSSLTKNSGDLLIAIVIIHDGNSTNAEFSSWGGGFTEFVDQAGTSTQGIGCAYKWSTGSETGTFTVTSADASSTDSAFFLLSIEGAHASTPPEGGTIATGTSSAANPGSFNPSGWDAEDTLWIAIAGNSETATTGSFTAVTAAPTNYTDYVDSGISADVIGGIEGAVAFRQLNAASEDVGTFTVDVSNARNSALLIAVRPAEVAEPIPVDLSYSHVGTSSAPIKSVGKPRSYSHVGTQTKIRSVGVIKAYSHVGTETEVKSVGLGAKAYSHTGTMDSLEQFVVLFVGSFSHVGTLAVSKQIGKVFGFAHSATETALKAVTLTAKAFSHTGTAVARKSVGVLKNYGHTASLTGSTILAALSAKAYAHIATLTQSHGFVALKALAYSAVHTLVTATQFIAGGGGPVGPIGLTFFFLKNMVRTMRQRKKNNKKLWDDN